MMQNFSEASYVKHTKRITEGELWDLVKTGRKNANNNGVLDGVIYRDSTEYSIHALADDVNEENRNDQILVTRSRDYN